MISELSKRLRVRAGVRLRQAEQRLCSYPRIGSGGACCTWLQLQQQAWSGRETCAVANTKHCTLNNAERNQRCKHHAGGAYQLVYRVPCDDCAGPPVSPTSRFGAGTVTAGVLGAAAAADLGAAWGAGPVLAGAGFVGAGLAGWTGAPCCVELPQPIGLDQLVATVLRSERELCAPLTELLLLSWPERRLAVLHPRAYMQGIVVNLVSLQPLAKNDLS